MPVDGKVAYMKCGNKMCVNPAHVGLTSRKATSAKSAKKMTETISWKMKQKRIARARSKLTMDDAIAIRAAEGITQRALAAKYGVDQKVIHRILKGQSWNDHSPMGMMAMQLR
jgi:ribosome-binding protein aMBF1 (putative translation factor)